MFWEKGYSYWMSSVKTMLWVGILENCQIGQIMAVLWEWGVEEALILFWSSGGCQAAGFYHYLQAVGFQDYCRAGKGGDGNRARYNPTNFTVFTDFQLFFLSESSPIAAILWLISRGLKRFILTFFSASIFLVFMEERVFKVPYSAIFYYHPSVVF